MDNFCEECKKLCQGHYWNRVSNHQFFKIMLGAFEHHLRIPRMFTKYYCKEKFSRRCILKGPSGNKWIVELTKTYKDSIFMDGWSNFVKDHNVKAGYLLIFSYGGNSEFQVSIFDGSACEVEISHFANKTSRSSKSLYSCSSSLHGHLRPESESESESESACGFVNSNGDLNDSDGECSQEEEDIEKSPSKEEDEETYYNPEGRQVRVDEAETAKQLATEFLLKNEDNGSPMFLITLLPSHVTTVFRVLTIPKEWAVKHMSVEPHEVELRVEGREREWIVGCRWNRAKQCQLIAQWPTFVRDNFLEEYDVCVFQLLKTKMDRRIKAYFNVHIFRIV